MILLALLPHERARLEQRLDELGMEQAVVAETLSEAMDQSSETYHDNAPADAANLESKRVTNDGQTSNGIAKKARHRLS